MRQLPAPGSSTEVVVVVVVVVQWSSSGHLGGELVEHVNFVDLGVARHHALHHVPQPGRTLAARRALTARLVSVACAGGENTEMMVRVRSDETLESWSGAWPCGVGPQLVIGSCHGGQQVILNRHHWTAR